MKYFGEKEKKLKIALDKLKKLNLIDEDSQKNLKILSDQKNQLEIEKKELQSKHKNLINEHQKLKDHLKKHFYNQLNKAKNIEALIRVLPIK